jgi:hypothetical protein
MITVRSTGLYFQRDACTGDRSTATQSSGRFASPRRTQPNRARCRVLSGVWCLAKAMSLWQLQALLRHFWRHEPAGHAVGAALREQPKRPRRTVLRRPVSPVVQQRARPASGPDSATIRLRPAGVNRRWPRSLAGSSRPGQAGRFETHNVCSYSRGQSAWNSSSGIPPVKITVSALHHLIAIVSE